MNGDVDGNDSDLIAASHVFQKNEDRRVQASSTFHIAAATTRNRKISY